MIALADLNQSHERYPAYKKDAPLQPIGTATGISSVDRPLVPTMLNRHERRRIGKIMGQKIPGIDILKK